MLSHPLIDNTCALTYLLVELVIGVAEWTGSSANKILDRNGRVVKVSPVRLNGVKSDIGTGWGVVGGHSSVELSGSLRVGLLPAGVNTVNVGVQSPPDRILDGNL